MISTCTLLCSLGDWVKSKCVNVPHFGKKNSISFIFRTKHVDNGQPEKKRESGIKGETTHINLHYALNFMLILFYLGIYMN